MFRNKRNAQAAMEFLLTYGWAILVVLAAIAALAYFGVLSPERLLPEKCLLEPGLACVQHKVDPTTITLVMINGLGRTIKVTDLQVGACSGSFNNTMQNGVDTVFTLSSCDNGLSKDIFKGEITLSYVDPTYNLTKTVHGDLVTKVE